MPFREKVQVNEPMNTNEDDIAGRWVDDRSARVKKGLPGREGRHGGDHESKAMNNAVFYGGLPPGTDIEDAETSDIRKMGVSIAGNNPTKYATGDYTNDELSAKAIKDGFTKKPMSPTDDNNEQRTGFYDSITVDGRTGFVERMNVKDRL